MRICLVHMPFAKVGEPSFALTQLKGVLEEEFGDALSVEIHYLNMDFALFFGVEQSDQISFSQEIVTTGIGEWFFRRTAFPDVPDVSDVFLNRYFPSRRHVGFRTFIRRKRDQLGEFFDSIMREHRFDQADIVGFSSMYAQNLASISLANRIKGRNSSCVIVVGGANCISPMGQQLARHVPSIDFVCSGPALVSFPTLVNHLHRREEEACHRIKGVFSHRNSLPGQTHADALGDMSRGEDRDINRPPPLSYDGFFSSLRSKLGNRETNPVLFFETSRGCWWGEKSRCSFCGLDSYNTCLQAMKPEVASRVFQGILRYAPECKHFMATDICIPRHFPEEVFSRIHAPDDVFIWYEARPELTVEELRYLSQAGIKGISVGIECLSTSSLRLVSKGTNAFQNIEFLKRCLLADVFPSWLFLVGIPGETGDTYSRYIEDLPKLFHLTPPYYFSHVVYERFNEYFNHPDRYGLDLRPFDFYGIVYPFPKEVARDLATHFYDANTTAPHYQYLFEWHDELRDLMNLWNARWFGPDAAVRPLLCFKDGPQGKRVYDSRTTDAKEYDLSDCASDLLRKLERPCRLDELSSAVPDLTREEFRREFRSLLDRDLLFREGDRYLSLVVPYEPPALTFTEKIGVGDTLKRFSWEKIFDKVVYEEGEGSADGDTHEERREAST